MIIYEQQGKGKTKNKTAHGKIFELEFLNSFQGNNIFFQRVKDDTLRYKNVQNFCDFICFSYPHLYLLELKTTKQKSLPFSNISHFQIDSLFHYSQYEGIKAGLVINFRSHDYQTFLLPAEIAYPYYNNADRRSFPLEWVQDNGIFLPSTLARTRYRFDISPLLNF
ncbi:Holliday junction resolvase RecU [Metabacillus schmidteae]|uniref:Holliday junction resolvase RecU n=1 Tax=Metabacillus schmidteae TaxID=2730405 RepID=UPI00158E95AC|nr:Holliday junction resolvase RecU [Metabacillus schmidteae]